MYNYYASLGTLLENVFFLMHLLVSRSKTPNDRKLFFFEMLCHSSFSVMSIFFRRWFLFILTFVEIRVFCSSVRPIVHFMIVSRKYKNIFKDKKILRLKDLSILIIFCQSNLEKKKD